MTTSPPTRSPAPPKGNKRAVTSGFYSKDLIKPLRERYLERLRDEFPDASERTLVVQAARLVRMEQLERFIDERGVIRHKRRGDIFPAVAMAEQISRGYLQTQERLEAQRRDHNKPESLIEQWRCELPGGGG